MAADAALGQRDEAQAELTVEILPAGWRDLRGLVALQKPCFGRDAWGLLEVFFALAGPTLTLKAVAGQRLVGLVMGDPRWWLGYSWIAALGVIPEFRRLGIGARLLAEAEARLPTPRLKLTVRRSNAPAIALYRKFGYAQTGVWENYYAGGEAGLVMEKRRPGP